MEYRLEIAAPNGDLVPLYAVASAMAKRDATAGGTPFHKPMYEGRLYGYIRALLEEVRSGRLEVCDSYGSPIAIDSDVAATVHFGYATRYRKGPDWKALRKKTPPANIFWTALREDWKRVREASSQRPDWKGLQSKWEKIWDATPGSPAWKKLCRYWEALCREVSPVEPDWHHGEWSFSS